MIKMAKIIKIIMFIFLNKRKKNEFCYRYFSGDSKNLIGISETF